MRNTTRRTIWKRCTVLLLLAVLGFGGWYSYGFYRAAAALTGNNNPLQLVSAFSPTTLSSTNGRTNILLAGYSNDDPGHQGAQLTDSIMILSIDHTNKTVVVISVPRDLYVNIPGYGYAKINAAYEDGGMVLLEQTVQQATGIQSNYSALINYTAFKDVVNAVGGVSVTITGSSPAGLYDPNTNLQLANGTVSLNGQTALNLARARGDGTGSYGFVNGDFDRSAHQQQILTAVAAKANSGLSLAQFSKLATALGDNVKTDLQLNDIKTLYELSKNIQPSSIKTITLNNINGQDLLSNYTTVSGQSALVPTNGVDDYSAITTALAAQLSN